VIAVFYHRWVDGEPSLHDEMALLTVTILMVVTGRSWQVCATTPWGGALLILYLIVLVASLAYHPPDRDRREHGRGRSDGICV